MITKAAGIYREARRKDTLLILRRTYFRIDQGLICGLLCLFRGHAAASFKLQHEYTRLISFGGKATTAIAENEIRITADRSISMKRINGGRIKCTHLNDF